ncbi:MAG: hypothetical protein HY721_06445, partial [Planctomycetes bacterium]|nr:hypothetical protein [Planctomycetota bacterium]
TKKAEEDESEYFKQHYGKPAADQFWDKRPIAPDESWSEILAQKIDFATYDLDLRIAPDASALEAVARFRVEKPERRPDPPRLVETRWPDGRRMLFAPGGQVNFMLGRGARGKIPFYERGVTTRLVPDDGTARWRELYERASVEPVETKE